LRTCTGTCIYQTSLNAWTVPNNWKMAHVVPIFKKGDKSIASNNRPILLTAICSKVMEHILYSNIMGHFEQHSILILMFIRDSAASTLVKHMWSPQCKIWLEECRTSIR
jgi:hypothetical protein